ncbi:FHA domain-containing protein [Oceanicoccus sp. KOV_DT_Chl]|uniref:FHA domain-containing protein n=1 Tax=Oceanicoccus sp. KOV_DT_Chl TaxID=1904639 RepID=UPI000C7BC7F5|nr:FHA domain-containing protein [Oceanicoccus sp. KOV_DT_Chl]
MATTYKLIALDSDDEFEINQACMSIGRDKSADIVLRHGYPSRQHARITVDDGQLTIEDLNSTNGTYVNNSKLHRPQILNEGDVIQFDSIAYHVVPAASPIERLSQRI